jgi:hypothetical protein
VSNDGIAALNRLAKRLRDNIQNISIAADTLESELEANRHGLGIHCASIARLIHEMRQSHQEACTPVLDLSDKIAELANDYQEFVDTDRFLPNGAYSIAGVTATSGDAQSAGSGDSVNATGGYFNGIPVSPVGNGDYFIEGNHYPAFRNSRDNYDEYSYDTADEVEIVDPCDIEGVHVSSKDLFSPENFWGMHAGSKEKWDAYAAHVEIAREMDEAGISKEEIMADPVIGEAAGVHFQGDMNGLPRVIKNEDGYYEFDADGRHRIIVARERGYKIPVRVVGIKKKEKI